MQRSLLPRAAPELPELELGDVYESSARVEVGGDVYDYLTLADGRLAVVLGDVTGHGVDATADMAMAKFVFRSLARDHADAGRVPRRRERGRLLRDRARASSSRWSTLVLDPESGEVACASARPPAAAARAARTARSRRSRRAASRSASTRRRRTRRSTASFPPGAIVVAYTDGVVEARRDGEQFGLERLDALLAEQRTLPPQQIADAALAACRDWTDGGELTDDFAVVVIKRSGP